MAQQPVCSVCGSENEVGSRYCRSCGASLAPETGVASETRRVVTILFCDVVGSTPIAEALDAESFQQMLARYFAEMTKVIKRHGGVTEKFIGDAIMAVFGIPRLHEDDALRAVRAAVEMRSTLGKLNEEFERTWGVRIGTRTGLNTGEVVAGNPDAGESFAVGDAVNVAARLEQTAGAGEILIGESTYRMVRDAVSADPLAPRDIKGKSEPITAWNVREVIPGAPGWQRRLDSPLVGREDELTILEEAFRDAAETRACRVVTVIGPAGVGKSRLTREFLGRIGDRAKIVRGRCLPYGEGITFWPIVQAVRDAAGIGELDSQEIAHAKIVDLIASSADSALVGERVAALLGVFDVTPGIQETFWAVRKLIEEVAGHGPLIVVFDDIHSGESTFLDLVEYLVEWIRDVPVLILCLTRPELFENRGSWMTAKSNATAIALQPLTDSETEGLITSLLGGFPLKEAQDAIADAAEGNPLFVEETLRMLIDDGFLRLNGGWTLTGDLSRLAIPPTIHALLGARLDRLDDDERAVIQRASVIGRVFWWGAVSFLSTEELTPRVGSILMSLARKELIRAERSSLSQEDAYRFAHILVRDAAYRGIPKATRAELHEEFADWMKHNTRDVAGEYEEIVGYHLEQAFRSLMELGPTTERMQDLGRRASLPLASAGRRAFARGDMPAAVNLLSRAEALCPDDDPTRFRLLSDLAFALLETGDFGRLQDVVSEAKDVAGTSTDTTQQARSLILGLWMRLFTDPEGWAPEAQREATWAISTFEADRDEQGQARAWSLLGLVNTLTCQFAAAGLAWETAAGHAHLAGEEREELEYWSWVPLAMWGGPTPVEEAIERSRSVLDRAAGDRKAASTALFTMGKLEAMRGRFDEARELIASSRSTLEEIALPIWMAGPLTQMAGWVEILADDPAGAEQILRAGVETLREIGELAWMSTVAAILAEALWAQGRDEEAESFILVSEEGAGSEDVYSQGMLGSVRAKVMARRGEAVQAERLGRAAVAIAEPTDFLFLRAFTLTSLAEVLLLGGEAERAEEVIREALAVCEQKGFLVGVERIRKLQGATGSR